MNIRKIGVGHIKDAMNHGYVIETRGKNKGLRKYASLCTQERIKSMCNLMFDYALERKKRLQSFGNIIKWYLLQIWYLFNLPCGSSFKPFTYDIYDGKFHHVIDALDFVGFTPHCTRHTFATQAEICGLRERAIKLIMGHSVKGDVTNQHYKHTGLDYLYHEICKITFEGGESDEREVT